MSCDYKVYKSELIVKYSGQMITDLYAVHEFFKKSFPEKIVLGLTTFIIYFVLLRLVLYGTIY